MKNLICIILWCCSFYVNSSVITLINNNSITCVLTERHLNATVYLSSDPLARFRKEESGSFITDWITSDWYNQSIDGSYYSTTLNYFMSRWHDIPIKTRTDQGIHFRKSECTIIFSLYTNESIRLEIIDSTFTAKAFLNLTKENLSTTTDCRWQTFIIKNINNAIQMNAVFSKNGHIEEQEVASTSVSFNPRHLFLRNMSSAFLKIDNDVPSYFWSNHSSIEQVASLILSLNDSGDSCITASISIDEGCQLDFVLECEDDRIETKNFTGFNKFGQDKQWMRIEMPTDCKGPATLTLLRNRNDTNNQIGYWAIDRLQNGTCTTNITNHIETWTTNSPINGLKNDSRCLLLDHIVTNTDKKSCTRKGYYGENCEFNCALLDKGCKGYRICQGKFNFTCDWDFDGEYCDEITTTNSTPNISSRIISNSTKMTPTETTFLPHTKGNVSTVDNNTGFDPVDNNYDRVTIIIVSFILLSLLILIIVIVIIKWRKVGDALTNLNEQILENSELLEVQDLRRINIQDFESFIKNSLTSNSYEESFIKLPQADRKSRIVGTKKENIMKNSSQHIIPYDENRVILKKMRWVGKDNYINASYIDGYGRSRAFICTQTPKSSTSKDFWRMIWQQDIKLIIMASNYYEELEKKCVEYFPVIADSPILFGDLGVRLIRSASSECFEYRMFEMNYCESYKNVQHYQLKWNPNNGRPLYPNDLKPLLEILNRNYEISTTPIVIHCSSGIGRSAVLILCHLALRMMESKSYVDFLQLIRTMRRQRPIMIQNLEDFILCHLVVAESLIANHEVSNSILNKNMLQIRLQYLKNYKYHDDIMKRMHNTTTFRSYILINGYDMQHQYIPYTQPKDSSGLEDFWKFVLNNKITTIVFMNGSKMKLWPCTFFVSETKPCAIVETESRSFPYYDVSYLTMKNDDLASTTIYEAEIIFVQFKNWISSKAVPEEEEPLLRLVVDIKNMIESKQNSQFPILICCRDGITGTGLFLTLTYVISKFTKELVYDIENGIRILRREDSKFLGRSDQVGFLFKAIAFYSQKLDPYCPPESDH